MVHNHNGEKHGRQYRIGAVSGKKCQTIINDNRQYTAEDTGTGTDISVQAYRLHAEYPLPDNPRRVNSSSSVLFYRLSLQTLAQLFFPKTKSSLCVRIAGILLLVYSIIGIGEAKTLIFTKGNRSIEVCFTDDGRIISSVPIQQGDMQGEQGDLFFSKNGENKLIVTDEGVEIPCEQVTENYDNNDASLPDGLKFKKDTGDPDKQVKVTVPSVQNSSECVIARGKVITPDNVQRQPNYVRTSVFQNENDYSPVTTTSFYDGSGRQIQQQVRSSTVGAITSGTYYDESGRPVKTTKPALLQTAGYFCPMADGTLMNQTKNTYPQAGDHPFTETKYYPDPTNRVRAAGNIGDDYAIKENDPHHPQFWYFGVTGNGNYLSNYFNAQGFIKSEFLHTASFLDNTLPQALSGIISNEKKYYLYVTRDQNNNFTQELVDLFGRTVRTWSDATRDDHGTGEIIAHAEYDILGNLLKEISPSGNDDYTTYRYNTLGQLVSKYTHDYGEIQYSYDDAGRIKSVIKGTGTSDEKQLHYEYDSFGRLWRIKDGSAVVSCLLYDTAAVLDSLDGYICEMMGLSIKGTIATELHNLRTRLVAAVSVGYGTEGEFNCNNTVVDIFSYTDEGEIEAKYKYIYAAGWHKTSYFYDNLSRLTKTVVEPQYEFTNPPAPIVRTYTYDHMGRPQTVAKADSSKKIVQYEYTDISQLAEKKFFKSDGASDAITEQYSYTVQDWLKKIEAGALFSSSYGYEGSYNGNITRDTIVYNGSVGKTFELGYQYDGVNRLTHVSSNREQEIYKEAFRYYEDGKIRDKRKNSDPISYTEAGADYIYYPKGSDPTHKLARVSSLHGTENNYSYDSRGNMIEDKAKKMHIGYDWRDMAQVYTFKDNGDTVSKVDMTYDAFGKRVRKVEYKREPSSGNLQPVKATAYVDDILVMENSDPMTMEYALAYHNEITPTGIEGRTETSSGNTAYYIKDHLGSVRSVVDDQGQLVEATMYDAYGRQYVQAYGPERFKERFSGKEFDEDGAYAEYNVDGIGLNYFGFRYYDPVVGIWTTVDPVEEFWSPYTYCANNPVYFVDPLGLHHVNGGSDISHTTLDRVRERAVQREMEKAYTDKKVEYECIIPQYGPIADVHEGFKEMQENSEKAISDFLTGLETEHAVADLDNSNSTTPTQMNTNTATIPNDHIIVENGITVSNNNGFDGPHGEKDNNNSSGPIVKSIASSIVAITLSTGEVAYKQGSNLIAKRALQTAMNPCLNPSSARGAQLSALKYFKAARSSARLLQRAGLLISVGVGSIEVFNHLKKGQYANAALTTAVTGSAIAAGIFFAPAAATIAGAIGLTAGIMVGSEAVTIFGNWAIKEFGW